MTSTLIAYRTPPQMERKALQEAREAGHRAYLPREPRTTQKGVRRVPTARGYVFAKGKPSDAEHIRGAIGPVSRAELRRLYIRTSATQIRHAFAPGDAVSIKRGRHTALSGTVAEIYRGCWYDVRITLLGKSHIVKLKESDLARAHPGT
jgi:transcription antitermination factor NusG